jgi:tetratricopeptide (TPR) repeat protein
MSAALGYAYANGGRLAEALSLQEQGLARATSIGMLDGQSLQVAWLGETHHLAGRADDAMRLCGRALELAREHRERGNEAWTLRLLAEVAVTEAKDADGYYRQALVLAEELGMRPLAAHCHLGLGTLYRRTSDRVKAQEHLTTATTMYREMGMGFWLEKADAELRGVER